MSHTRRGCSRRIPLGRHEAAPPAPPRRHRPSGPLRSSQVPGRVGGYQGRPWVPSPGLSRWSSSTSSTMSPSSSPWPSPCAPLMAVVADVAMAVARSPPSSSVVATSVPFSDADARELRPCRCRPAAFEAGSRGPRRQRPPELSSQASPPLASGESGKAGRAAVIPLPLVEHSLRNGRAVVGLSRHGGSAWGLTADEPNGYR